MSWQATAYVKNLREGLTRSEKFMLLILADYHNEETGRCDASVRRLAADCLMNERTAQRQLSALASKGFISIERREDPAGGSRTNQYWLTCLNDIGEGGGTMPPPGGGAGITQGVAPRSGGGGAGIRGGGGTHATRTVNKNLKVNRKVNSGRDPASKSLFEQGKEDQDDQRTQANSGGADAPSDPDPLADRISRLDQLSARERLLRRTREAS